MSKNTVQIKFLADVDGMNKGIQQANAQLAGFGKSVTKIGASLVGVFAADKILDLGKSAVLAASDFEEMSSKVAQVFGAESQQRLQDWASNAATSMGLSKTAALEAASTFGVLGDKAGLSGKDLEQFSTGLSGLAADMASFSNTSVDEAIAAIGSGLRGEAEPLRKYGVLLDDATLKAEALKLGIYAGNGVLTAQQKILAANAAIYTQTSKAQGDFARTSDGLANQMRVINAEIENLTLTLGQGLMKGFGGTEDAGQAVIDVLKAMEPAVAFLGESIGGLLKPIGTVVIALGEISKALDTVTTDMGGFTIGADKLAYGLNPVYWSLQLIGKATEQVTDQVHRWNQSNVATIDNLWSASDAYYVNEKAAVDNAVATEAAAESMDDLNKAVASHLKIYNTINSTIDWERYWDKFKKNVDKGTKSLDLSTEAGRKNAEELLEGASLISSGYQTRLDQGWSPDAARQWALTRFNKLKDGAIDAGFKTKDVEKILNVSGFDSVTSTLINKAATAGGAIGRGLGDGMIEGMAARERSVAAQAARLTAIAEAAAREESETHSPSQKWYLLGLDLVAGLSKGFSEGTLTFQNLVTDSMKGLTITAVSEVEQVPTKMADAYKAKLGHLQQVLDEQGAIIKSGLDAIKSMSDGFVQQIVGNISFKTQDDQGNALSPEQMMQAIGFDIQKQKDAVAAIATNIGTTLPPALLSQILAMPPDTAIQLANYLGSNPQMLTQLVTNYQALATSTETTLGVPMGLAWAKVGDQSAVAAIDAAKERIELEADTFKKWVKSKLNTKIYIDVEYRMVNNPNDVMRSIGAYESANGTTWRT